jgi:hypothetical protein
MAGATNLRIAFALLCFLASNQCIIEQSPQSCNFLGAGRPRPKPEIEHNRNILVFKNRNWSGPQLHLTTATSCSKL